MNTKLQVQYRPIESVSPYASNARIHSKKQVSQVSRSILEFGFMAPILVDEKGTIIAGHCRLEAAKEIGLKVIPVIQAKHLSKSQVRAYRLADNKLALDSDWDDDLLRVELKFLSSIEIDFDLSLTGFSGTETDLIFGADEPLPGDEFTPEIPSDENVIVKPGDVYQMDQHRIICGDCRDTETVDQL
jgi:ParB-like chromosome segregation protein Spo0J